VGNLKKSTLLKKFNAGDIQGAALQFKSWNKAGGKVLTGLTRRREAEMKLFLS
jgi:GH24 family phage-related lysozyme (muramidase)